MKKIFALIFVILLIFVPFSVSALDALDTDTPPDEKISADETVIPNDDKPSSDEMKVPEWREYIEGTVIPAAVAAIGAIGALCLAASPIIKSAKKVLKEMTASIGHFAKATKAVNLANTNKAETEKRVATMLEAVEHTKDTVDSTIKELGELISAIQYIKERIDVVEKIERVAFENSKDLVVSGIAAEIERIGKGDEEAS